MKFTKLRLIGFKSFVDAESLDFSGGMTAIVGPNGCGKSNVCDAVCWVLGERSAKSLRGEKMEDVIFSGSANRGPLGLAEVELTLTTESTIEHAEDGRLTIGRRLHRSGESQYLLNGRSVRLKDVRNLLMDTGLGVRAYSVIEHLQDQVGKLIDAIAAVATQATQVDVGEIVVSAALLGSHPYLWRRRMIVHLDPEAG